MPSGKRPASLATRLSAWYACSAFLLLLTATGFLYFILVRNFKWEDNEYLVEKVGSLQTLLRDHPHQFDTVEWEVQEETSVSPSIRVLSRVISSNGKIVVETNGMARELPLASFPEPAAANGPLPSGREIHTASGKTFRVLSTQVPEAAGTGLREGNYTLQVGVDLTFEKELLDHYRHQLWVVLGLGFIACIFIGHRIARRGLRPLNEISAAIARTRSTNLKERVREEHLPAELLDLAATFNELMGRLSDSFGRLSQFSSDIAHELRSPVNNLRGEIDVALSKSRSPAEYQDLLGSLSEECDHLKSLIDSLLFLARAEQPETQVHRENLDIKTELEIIREFYDAPAGEAGVTLSLVCPDDSRFLADRTLFKRAIGNLVQNALAHTPSTGHVRIVADPAEDQLVISVVDDGIGISPEHLARVFDRFYRVDPARAKDTGGVGLGLAIVQSIARLHGGKVEITSELGKGTTVALVLPFQTGVPTYQTAEVGLKPSADSSRPHHLSPSRFS